MSFMKSFHFQVKTVRSRKVLGLRSCYMSQDPEGDPGKGRKDLEGGGRPNTRSSFGMECLIKPHALHHWAHSTRRRGASFREYLPWGKHNTYIKKSITVTQ